MTNKSSETRYMRRWRGRSVSEVKAVECFMYRFFVRDYVLMIEGSGYARIKLVFLRGYRRDVGQKFVAWDLREGCAYVYRRRNIVFVWTTRDRLVGIRELEGRIIVGRELRWMCAFLYWRKNIVFVLTGSGRLVGTWKRLGQIIVGRQLRWMCAFLYWR